MRVKRLLVLAAVCAPLYVASCSLSADDPVSEPVSDMDLLWALSKSMAKDACPIEQVSSGSIDLTAWRGIDIETAYACGWGLDMSAQFCEKLRGHYQLGTRSRAFHDPDGDGIGQCDLEGTISSARPTSSSYGSGNGDSGDEGYDEGYEPEFDQDGWEQDQYEQDLYCEGDCTDMDDDGRTWDDYDADGDGLYESP